MSSADPSSDWNAPAEEWGNWVDEERASLQKSQEPIPDDQKVSKGSGGYVYFSVQPTVLELLRVTFCITNISRGRVASERHSNHICFSHLMSACLLSITVSSFHKLLRILLCGKHYYILIRKKNAQFLSSSELL